MNYYGQKRKKFIALIKKAWCIGQKASVVEVYVLLDLSRILFSKQVQFYFGDLTDLKQLYLFNNQLTGTVPEGLKNLKSLSGVGIENNLLSASEIPYEVCELVHHQHIEMWADCSGEDALQCPCCKVCCPGETCI